MGFVYKAQSGDCISSIAFSYGLLPETIWLHANNDSLRAERKNPNILFSGDSVFVPERIVRTEKITSGQRHKFVRKAVPSILRVRFLDDSDEPRSNIEYRADIDGNLRHGTTDDDGFLVEPISPNALHALIFLGSSNDVAEYNVQLGQLPPINTNEGIQARLKNLGYYNGDIDGQVNDLLTDALWAFQEEYKLTVSGELDKPTEDTLEQLTLS